MRNDYNHLINEVMKSLDWEMILGVHKMFKKGIGCEPLIIPGVKRKPNPEEITVKDLKNELKLLIQFVIEKGSGEINYGLWYVSWYNNEDERYIDYPEDEEDELTEEELSEFQPWFPTKLQVVLAPQRIAVMDSATPLSESVPSVQSAPVTLENMLEDAIKKEDYELANKLKDVIAYQDKNKKEDK
jgi:hypothetical protein